MQNIPLIDLRQQHEPLAQEIIQALSSILASGNFILGNEVQSFEQEIAAFCERRFAVGVASGTDALIISLKTLEIGREALVITSPFSFISSATSILSVGAKPVFADIDPQTFNLDPLKVQEKITDKKFKSKIKAILVVHLYGLPADLPSFEKITKSFSPEKDHNEIKLIADGAQALGSEIDGKPALVRGHFSTISFYPTKNLGALGDAGMILCDNEDYYQKAKLLRVHGSPSNYVADTLGYCSRLDELQAAFLRIKFQYLPGWTEKRRQLAKNYQAMLKSSRAFLPKEPTGFKHVYHQYVIRYPQRDELKKYLLSKNIGCAIYYPQPLHLQKVFKELDYQLGDFPEAEKASQEVLALPIFPELKLSQQEQIAEVIYEFEKKF